MAYQKIITEKFVCDYCGEEILEESNFMKLGVHHTAENCKSVIRDTIFQIDICKTCLCKIFEKAKFNGDTAEKEYITQYIKGWKKQ